MKLSDVTPDPPPLVLRLELTKAEAQALYDILTVNMSSQPAHAQGFAYDLCRMLNDRGYRVTPKEP